MNGNVRAAMIILRWGLAFCFFYAAVASLRHPQDWVGFFPMFVRNMVPDKLLLTGFSIFEIVLAGWLFWGKKLLWAAVLAALSLAGVTLANLDSFDIVFRDVGLFFAALALIELARDGGHKETD
jgi:hypothetical protein